MMLVSMLALCLQTFLLSSSAPACMSTIYNLNAKTQLPAVWSKHLKTLDCVVTKCQVQLYIYQTVAALYWLSRYNQFLTPHLYTTSHNTYLPVQHNHIRNYYHRYYLHVINVINIRVGFDTFHLLITKILGLRFLLEVSE